MTFEEWWSKEYRSLTKTLNAQGIAFTAWHTARAAGLEEAQEEVDNWSEDVIRAEAYSDGFADGLEEAAKICDGYATIEGIAQKCAAAIRAAIKRKAE